MAVEVIGGNTGDDYSGTEDTRLRSGSPTTNYGTATEISAANDYFGNDEPSLVMFSGLSNISGPVTVSSATMSLHESQFSGTSPMAAEVFRLKRNWVEAEATYNIYSTGNSWQTAGAGGANDIDTVASSSPSLTSTNDYQSITGLGTDVADFINGVETNYGWKVTGNESDDRFMFYTSDDIDGQRPYLTVDWTAAASSGGNSLTLLGVT